MNVVVLVLIIVCKLWLAAAEEIHALNLPHDDLLYLALAKNWYWGEAYSDVSWIRLPAFPIWIAIVHALGIPLRLANELLFLGGASFFSLELAAVARRRWVAPFLTALLVFNPATFFLLRYATPDAFYLSVLLFCFGAMARIVRYRSTAQRWMTILGILVGILLLPRDEGEVVSS